MTTDTQQLTIPSLSIIDVPAFQALCFTTVATLPQVPQLGDVPAQLYDDATRLGLTIAGPVQYSYEGVSGDVTNEFTLTIALPVREPEPGTLSDGFVFASVPAFRAVTFTYTGAWDTFMPMYDALFAAFYEQGYAYSGNLREVYTVVDLGQPERCVTEILIGIR
ncbi:transcription activator, effector binding protein [Fibrella aestuarina BUZ 2]|uniref:Transcription activator, effector binding protein n=1 Tax=Fibrella aestuarina BUZ 2 TaxID=1166018 RepID=I0K4I0_9BACT|nr:GyrI-like domain-containing protein [Fibrella aestuarina]CCG99033.1 transcription activator, effector binding protein [Fibrella aestuarina BUZ 2]